MIEVLEKHLSQKGKHACVVADWISSLTIEEQELFNKVKEDKDISVASLFSDLSKQVKLPFKLTAFRSHIRGYCTCQ